MNRLNQTLKKCVAFGVTGIMLILAGCKSPAGFASNDNEEYNARMEEARTTPFGAYPETIEYTLGKMTICRRMTLIRTMRTHAILSL